MSTENLSLYILHADENPLDLPSIEESNFSQVIDCIILKLKRNFFAIMETVQNPTKFDVRSLLKF